MNNNLRKNIESIQNDGVGKTNTYNFNSVQVRTMPKGFKRSVVNNNADGSKKTGFVILVLGSLFLFLILGVAYYYFIASPDKGSTNQVPITKEPESANNKVVVDSPKKEEDSGVASEKELTESQEVSPLSDSGETSLENGEELVEGEEQNIDTDSEEPSDPERQTVGSEPSVIIDKDRDGLSSEEELAFGTSDDLVDTDGDTYTDLSEMLNGYNPIGDGTLLDNPNFIEYKSDAYNFSFIHPKLFKISANSNDIIIFDLENGEFLQIFIEKNESKLNIESWYKNQHNVSVVADSQKSQKGEWNVIRNVGNKTIFFKNDKNDYVIALNYSSNEGLRYANMLEIIFNSFKSTN